MHVSDMHCKYEKYSKYVQYDQYDQYDLYVSYDQYDQYDRYVQYDKYGQYDRYAKKYDESEPPPKLYVKILKISKISKICNLKTGLPPGGRPVLRSQPYAIYAFSAKYAQYEQVVLHLVCAGPVCAQMLRWTCSGVAQQ